MFYILKSTYLFRKTWGLRDGSVSNEEIVSSELTHPLFELSRSFAIIGRNIRRPDYTEVFKLIAFELDEWLWNRLVLVRDFGRFGANQLVIDFEKGICGSVRTWVRHPERYLPRIRDVCTIFKAIEQGVVTRKQLESELRSRAASAIMDELGIYKLSKEEVLDVASRRM